MKFLHGAVCSYRRSFIFYSAGSSAARSYPVSLVLSGFYDWKQAILNGGQGRWWSTRSYSPSPENAYNLFSAMNALGPEYAYFKQIGTPLRYINRPYGSTSARSYPVSLVFSGYYYWGRGNLSGISHGAWWTGSVSSYDTTAAAIISQISDVWLYDINGAYKEYAMTLRLRLHFRA